MFWWIAGAVVVALLAVSWWRAGRAMPGRRKAVSQDAVDIGRSGHQARHNTQFGPPGGSGSSGLMGP